MYRRVRIRIMLSPTVLQATPRFGFYPAISDNTIGKIKPAAKRVPKRERAHACEKVAASARIPALCSCSLPHLPERNGLCAAVERIQRPINSSMATMRRAFFPGGSSSSTFLTLNRSTSEVLTSFAASALSRSGLALSSIRAPARAATKATSVRRTDKKSGPRQLPQPPSTAFSASKTACDFAGLDRNASAPIDRPCSRYSGAQ